MTVTGNGTSGYRGTLTASVTEDATGDGEGTVKWTFTASDGALDTLAAGQTVTQTYTLTLSDGEAGGTSAQTSPSA